MNPTQQKLIDYCIDNPTATSDQVQEAVKGIIGIKSEDVNVNHQGKDVFDMFGTNIDDANKIIDRMNTIMEENNGETSKAYEVIYQTIPKHMLLLTLDGANKEIKRAHRMLQMMTMGMINRGGPF